MDYREQKKLPSGSPARGPGNQPAPYYYGAAYPDTGGDTEPTMLFDYVRILYRRKHILLLGAVLGVAAALALTLPKTPVYQARAAVEVQGINEDFLNMRDVNPTANSAPFTPELEIQTQVKILQSPSLISRTVARLEKENRLPLSNSGRLFWREVLSREENRPAVSPYDAVVASAPANLKVRPQAGTRVVEITYNSTSPRFAADFANALIAEYIDQNLEARWQTSQHTGEWLARQMHGLKTKLERSEAELQSYARASGLLFTSERENVNDQKLRQMQEELSRAQAERINRQSRYELVSSVPVETLPEVLDNEALRNQQGRLSELRREYAELFASFTPAHPRVVKVQAQIEAIEASIKKERANIVGRIENEYRAAQTREKLLAADYTAHARLISDQAAKLTHYDILKREVDSTRQLYESLLQRVKEAGVASALRASNIRVIDKAVPPSEPSSPNVPINVALGLFSGLILGSVLVLARERTDRSIQQPGHIGVIVGIPELGVVPRTRGLRLQLPGRQEGASTALTLIRSAGDGSIELSAWSRRFSPMADSFRSILTSILFTAENGARTRTIVFSSANPGEGKTTVASNLAIALAEINRRVLLIDGDLRRPRLHQIFGVDNSAGFSDLLNAEDDVPASAFAGLVQQTQIPNLFLLPSGVSTSTNPFHSPRLREFVNALRAEYDMVLIDTPPMLQMADARVLARQADGVVLVVRANQTTRDAALLALQRFYEDGSTVIGTVLNDWNPGKNDVYGYSKYAGYDRPARKSRHHGGTASPGWREAAGSGN